MTQQLVVVDRVDGDLVAVSSQQRKQFVIDRRYSENTVKVCRDCRYDTRSCKRSDTLQARRHVVTIGTIDRKGRHKANANLREGST